MTRRSRLSRAVVILAALVAAVPACGRGGESDEDRAALVERIGRLTGDRAVAECIAEEFGGDYTVEDIDTIIAARGDLTVVDFELVEDMSVATAKCTADDE